ncbi:glycoside hydrolase family 140 protein [Opitutales bacterium ASA1]|uniref:glycoside hydrolase family 140 protein n=1 Tax=Congregicoccus parvus TaxID=3081749 RepID=UPI002B2C9508|nr:glycoside hydrolase family 140 protein [Opitutales bacterium ASA1]
MLLHRLILAALAFSTSFASAQHLVVSPDARYLQRADGTPFIWIGDTAWELFHRLDREEAAHYLQRRAAQGFTVIQAVALAENDGLRVPNAYGEVPLVDLDPARPNERYFAHVDWIVNEAARLGLTLGLLPTWGDKLYSKHPGAGPIVFNPQNARAFGTYLGSRYRGNPIVWILGGDRGIDSPEVLETWRAMARGLREGDGGAHLITFHPRGATSSADQLHNEPWLDFNMYQSGHAHRYIRVHAYAERLALLRPRKPFLDAEPAYEDIPVAFWEFVDWKNPQRVPAGVLDERGLVVDRTHFAKGFFTDHDVRVHAYWNFLSGACGYTYGNNAVWQMYQAGRDIAIPCVQEWREAIESPGAAQMRHVRALLEAHSLALLVPDQSLVHGPNPEGPDHVRAAGSRDDSFLLAYLPRGRSVDLAPGTMAGDSVRARWFDPRTGAHLPASAVAAGDIRRFTPPDSGEGRGWVLVLDRPVAR